MSGAGRPSIPQLRRIGNTDIHPMATCCGKTKIDCRPRRAPGSLCVGMSIPFLHILKDVDKPTDVYIPLHSGDGIVYILVGICEARCPRLLQTGVSR